MTIERECDYDNKSCLYMILIHAITTEQTVYTQGIGAVMVGYGAGSLVNILNFGFFTNESFIGGSAIFIVVGVLKLVFSIMGMIQVGFTRKWIFSIVNLHTKFLCRVIFIPVTYQIMCSEKGLVYALNCGNVAHLAASCFS